MASGLGAQLLFVYQPIAELSCKKQSTEEIALYEAIENLRVAYSQVAQECGHRFLVMLGGEHSVTSAAVLAQADRHEERITVLQLDAHADLRAEYNGMAYSHACVMSHVLSRADVVSVGVRGVSKGEVVTSEATKGSTLIWARDMQDGDKWMDLAIEQLGPRVYPVSYTHQTLPTTPYV